MYRLLFLSQAQRDAKRLRDGGLKPKTEKLLRLIRNDPLVYPPAYEYLKGDMKGLISRRINQQHRLVYEIFEEENIIRIYRMWSHYE
uniref:Toxin-antitoxin system, toxin component, Txe/YoeB family n=1 Tax=Candidatus Kentrum eta TaxID=2126337 RepID=A0A450UXP2_9GAMM|nr:MAG: toxin-antitoxin system, toxin component, Txe/YoeB family [Candidatus Kentron sp. H]VFJ97297.1 MAG: toxin-antitoxin system, toxin component, Txe/YoeB family [Candidatus Kentron sp. H]VFK02869.1 MAG: toxin-antitoxin system, toxin component, Txe/YoeB family [Candidatus Kentron sp. H]